MGTEQLRLCCPGGWENQGDVGQREQTFSYKMNSGDLMYNMATIFKNNVLYTWNLLRM